MDARTLYQHTQRGPMMVLIGSVLTADGIIAGIFLHTLGLPLMLALSLPAFAGGLVIAISLSALTTQVTGRDFSWWFGGGFLRRTISLGEIASVTPCALSGIGVQLGAQGWQWNVGGREGIDLALHSGRHVRIGSNDRDALVNALTQARAVQ